MSLIIEGKPAASFFGPPADRMAGRPSLMAKAAAPKPQGNYKPKPKQSQSSAATTAARANAFLRREEALDNAVHQGVISSSLRAHFATLWDADPEGTRAHLESIGLARTQAQSDAYDESVLSTAERGRIAAAREGRGPRIINGGL
jgi:hypothetical protein